MLSPKESLPRSLAAYVFTLKPGFHIVVSVVSVVSVTRKKFIGQIQRYWKPPVQMLNAKETTDTTCCTR